MINKEKLKYLPSNIFSCLTSFSVPFFILTLFPEIKMSLVIGISLYTYLKDVAQSSQNDYLEQKIKDIENKQNPLT